ncbi:hypothetical protein BDFB_001164 [Asbolus verrucosus]|uniref:Uncharacterized protein n=1 Tax=Asbolus verrucosus TaxID=1661398 RepID=A0A482VM04_ASBVE|nr:hypothetical protein BDFB_001164 [Asbolus verrucosus]
MFKILIICGEALLHTESVNLMIFNVDPEHQIHVFQKKKNVMDTLIVGPEKTSRDVPESLVGLINLDVLTDNVV